MIYAIPEHQSLASAEEPEEEEAKHQENSNYLITHLDYELTKLHWIPTGW